MGIKLGKHRTRLNILGDILSVINANENVKKTKIMYEAYLSYSLLARYLNDVLKAGLATSDDRKCFMITRKGKKFLAKLSEYSTFCKTIKGHLQLIEDQKSSLEEMCPNMEISNSRKIGFVKKN